MIERRAQAEIARLLTQFPAVGILGPRQIGKTTLALQLASDRSPEPVYLDLEDPEHQARLSDPTAYLRAQDGRLIILDEIQRMPEISPPSVAPSTADAALVKRPASTSCSARPRSICCVSPPNP